jgi:hypothetical protein
MCSGQRRVVFRLTRDRDRQYRKARQRCALPGFRTHTPHHGAEGRGGGEVGAETLVPAPKPFAIGVCPVGARICGSLPDPFS